MNVKVLWLSALDGRNFLAISLIDLVRKIIWLISSVVTSVTAVHLITYFLACDSSYVIEYHIWFNGDSSKTGFIRQFCNHLSEQENEGWLPCCTSAIERLHALMVNLQIILFLVFLYPYTSKCRSSLSGWFREIAIIVFRLSTLQRCVLNLLAFAYLCSLSHFLLAYLHVRADIIAMYAKTDTEVLMWGARKRFRQLYPFEEHFNKLFT